MPYDTLISPTELHAHLGDDNWRLIDCRFSLTAPEAGYQGYLDGHIPGALYAHLENDLSSPIQANTGRHPLPTRESLVNRFSAWGIDSTTQVVVYDASSGMMAARLWWLLRWMGHAAVAVLDGGLTRWLREGNVLTNKIPLHKPRRFSASVPLEHCVTSEELQMQLKTPGYLLIDVRAAERYSGEVEPLDRRAGHIPGALNLPLHNNLDAEGNFLPPEQLTMLYQPVLRAHPPQGVSVSVMCGSGVTACHTILAMHIAGYHGATLYAGSWSEWITDPQRPTTTKED